MNVISFLFIYLLVTIEYEYNLDTRSVEWKI